MNRAEEKKLRRIISEATRNAFSATKNSRRRLLEDAEEGKEGSDNKVNWGANYVAFVKALKSNVADPKVKAFISAGKLDNDDNDDKFSFSETSLPVAGLKPTQNEIDVDKSLAWPLKKSKTFIEFVSGDGPFTLGGPIVTYKGQYIIDGHHRWSQLYACNKNAQINAVDITLEGLEPLEVLKAVQAAIAIETGDVPVQSVEGINLLKIDKSGLDSWLDSFKGSVAFFADVGANESVMEKMESAAGGSSKTEAADISQENLKKARGLVGEYIWTNVENMQAESKPVAGAPKRDFMPQTDDVNWKRPLEAGEVDIAEPHAKTEGRNRSEYILERWQKLAGLIK